MFRANDCQRNSRKNLANGTFSRMACSCVLLGFAMPLMAQGNTAASIKLGEADLTPSVRLDFVSNSNAFLTPSDETDVTGFILSPQLEYVADRRLLSFTLGYSGAFAGFSEDALNYADNRLTAGINANLSTKHSLRASVGVAGLHEQLGDGLTLGDGEDAGDQVERVDSRFEGVYTYGADNARGNIVAGFIVTNRDYQNRSDLTDGLDFTTIGPYARFTYRISGDTRAFVGVRLLNFDFDDGDGNRTQVTPSIGLSFAGTGKTGGEARIGVTTANFDDELEGDTTLFSAAIDMYYEPSDFSRFDIGFIRDLNNVDALGGGNSLASDSIDDNIDLTWTYIWSGFVTTRAVFAAELRQRECPTLGTDEFNAGFEIGLNPRRWIEIGAGFTQGVRNTDECVEIVGDAGDLDYDRQLINLFVRATL